MTNANELRIGNLAYNQYGKIGTVWGFKVGDATHDFEHIVSFKELNVNSCYSRYIKPIPLTPEILEKCGFEELEGNIYYKFFDYKEFRVFIHKENNSVFMYWKGNTVDDSVNNLPIHRLQNIIFALTGEEINYTP